MEHACLPCGTSRADGLPQNNGASYVLSQLTTDRDFSVSSILQQAVASPSDLVVPAPGTDLLMLSSTQGRVIALMSGLAAVCIVALLLLTVACMRHRCGARDGRAGLPRTSMSHRRPPPPQSRCVGASGCPFLAHLRGGVAAHWVVFLLCVPSCE